MFPQSDTRATFLKCLRETPKGIFVIATPWLVLAAYVLCFFIDINAVQRAGWSDLPTGMVGLPEEWNALLIAMECISAGVPWFVVIAGPIILATGLQRKRRTAINAARYLSLFWVLLIVVSFGLSLTDPYIRTEDEDWFYAGAVAYNFWSWWYLSCLIAQRRFREEWTVLDLHADH